MTDSGTKAETEEATDTPSKEEKLLTADEIRAISLGADGGTLSTGCILPLLALAGIVVIIAAHLL
jgi:hypothetical protein